MKKLLYVGQYIFDLLIVTNVNSQYKDLCGVDCKSFQLDGAVEH